MRKHLMIGGAIAALATGLTGCVGQVPLGGESSVAVAVTETGAVFGYRQVKNPTVPELSRLELVAYEGSAVRVIQAFDARESGEVAAVNDRGVAVGHTSARATGQPGVKVPRKWTASGGSDLARSNDPAVPDHHFIGQANDVNNAGTIVGSIANWGSANPPTGVIWSADGSLTKLPLPAGLIASEALGINEGGDIVGQGARVDGSKVALLWHGPARTPQVLRDPRPVELTGLRAEDINDAGVIIGTGYVGTTPRGIVWPTADAESVQLRGNPDNLADSATPVDARAINASGTVVGSAVTASGDTRAMRWDALDYRPTVLTKPGQSGSARDISDRGEIVGTVQDNGVSRAAILADPTR